MAAKEGGTSNFFYERYETDAVRRDTDVRLGEVIDETLVYGKASGYLKEIAASSSSSIQDLSFTYDKVGNLLTRANGLISQTETFDYDPLDRLTSSQVSGQSAVTIAYSDAGRITSKSDVGSYTYGDSGHPYAVTSANGVSYAYDANGRMTSRGGDAITWVHVRSREEDRKRQPVDGVLVRRRPAALQAGAKDGEHGGRDDRLHRYAHGSRGAR